MPETLAKIDVRKILDRLKPQYDAWDEAVTLGVFDAAMAQKMKSEAFKTEMEKETRKEKGSEEFTTAYVDRNPWVKDLQNARDMWSKHRTAISEDREAWEKGVLEAYLAKARAGSLSPLLALIGQYLLFFKNVQEGREHLLQILFLQDPSLRLWTHNWFVLDHSGTTGPEVHGPKVASLKAPLFPESNNPLLKELNARILEEVPHPDSLVGGSDDRGVLEKMFAPESEVLYKGGSEPVLLSVYHQDRSLTTLVVEVSKTQEACNTLDNQCKSGTSELWNAICMRREQFQRIRAVPQQYYNGPSHQQQLASNRRIAFTKRKHKAAWR